MCLADVSENDDRTSELTVSLSAVPFNQSGDYYQVLGVKRDATAREIRIAYHRLARRFHPDRFPNDGLLVDHWSSAQNHFSRISKAFAVLSDPIQRAQYDNTKMEIDCDGVHVKEVGLFIRLGLLTVDRFFQPVKTQIAVDVLEAAQSICLENDNSIQVQRLEPNKPVETTVRAHSARFFYVNIPNEYAEHGSWIHCKSGANDRFKLVLFDKEGELTSKLINSRTFDSNKSTADLFFVSHDLYVPAAVYYAGVRNRLCGLQNQLSDFQSSVYLQRPRLLEANRRHLLCVYGDNFFQSLSFSLTFMTFGRELKLEKLIDCGTKLKERKELAYDLESEYSQALEIKDEEQLSKLETRIKEELRISEEQLRNFNDQRDRLLTQVITTLTDR
ncbi:J domain-containing protein [Aphelenchoides besseyi]|nr:J domain-containing protein [Aphelenchoides besseyi]